MDKKIVLGVVGFLIFSTLFLSYSLSGIDGLLVSVGSIITGFILGSILKFNKMKKSFINQLCRNIERNYDKKYEDMERVIEELETLKR